MPVNSFAFVENLNDGFTSWLNDKDFRLRHEYRSLMQPTSNLPIEGLYKPSAYVGKYAKLNTARSNEGRVFKEL